MKISIVSIDSQTGSENSQCQQCCSKEPCSHKIKIKHLSTGFFNRQMSSGQEHTFCFDSQSDENLMRNYCTLPKFTPHGQPYLPCFQSDFDQQINLTRSSQMLTEFIKKKNKSKDKQKPLKAPQPLKKRTRCHICQRDFSEEGYFEHIESEEHKYNYYNNKYYQQIISLEKQFKKDLQENQNMSFSDNSSKESKNDSSGLYSQVLNSNINNTTNSEENQENNLQFSDWNLGDSCAAQIPSQYDHLKSENLSKIQSDCDAFNQNTSDDGSERKLGGSFVYKAIDFINNMIPNSLGDMLKTQKQSNYSSFIYETRRKSKKRTYSQVTGNSPQFDNSKIFESRNKIKSYDIIEDNITPNNQIHQTEYILNKQLKLHNSQSDSFQLQIQNKSTTCTSQKEPLIQNKIKQLAPSANGTSSTSLWDKVKKVFFSIIKKD
ncbi:hypothetical protein TTHERM_00492340 (macronuclear) [Tetrahymena thermophila SB210]|uniref:Uncharacterized protein n=1 Tax=Tetrahymena thermophila (strain SB210) TaxID=312017 RepID=I7M3C3_TETTS|nr:hypothetical protein TTHERM_00492340 [Tetrahymena thermophila SB210]EAS02881.2 hypothetical protein TTHERM_00492340 [Tetrahymena thermophila SB210]|eukprot:XP_001023126.2 hypothetical protein TTHERM_00492340 [Tetrahymena thermophila SB210]